MELSLKSAIFDHLFTFLSHQGEKILQHRGVTGIFFRGGKVIFPWFIPGVKCFFPVENSHFGTPKTNFSGLKSDQQASLFPVGQQKFPGEKCLGALCLRLLRHCFSTYVTYTNTRIFAHPIDLFAFPILKKKYEFIMYGFSLV